MTPPRRRMVWARASRRQLSCVSTADLVLDRSRRPSSDLFLSAQRVAVAEKPPPISESRGRDYPSLHPSATVGAVRCDGARARGSTPPSPLTAKPGDQRLLGSSTTLYHTYLPWPWGPTETGLGLDSTVLTARRQRTGTIAREDTSLRQRVYHTLCPSPGGRGGRTLST